MSTTTPLGIARGNRNTLRFFYTYSKSSLVQMTKDEKGDF